MEHSGIFALLKHGLCWYVGNGESIQVWSENWISNHHPQKPILRRILPDGATMSCLIDVENRCGNRNLVEDVFLPSEAEAILKMLVSYRLPEDTIRWSHTRVSAAQPSVTDVGKGRNLSFMFFKECTWMRSFWLASSLGYRVDMMSALNIAVWIDSVRLALPRSQFYVFVNMLWKVWFSRNMLLFEGKRKTPIDVLDRCMAMQNGVEQSTADMSRHIVAAELVSKWSPPPPGLVKLNTDASKSHDDCFMGLGAAIRDEDGQVLVSAANRIPSVQDIIQGEAQAILFGLHLAQDCSLRNVMVEGDALVVINHLNQDHKDLYLQGLIFEDIKHLVASFDSVSFCYSRRSNNQCAHGLAKWALNLDEARVIMEDVSSHIWPCILQDVSAFC
ncbi:uncharacterized protein LOC126682770 [Mercurialis annua]|uniref:uncharacterized protein LOC126682770 n=1 Tax=Mercurialis annua TaxID=3986 RepID=UPI0024ACB233|nr:uncharacterized protein LOC126682770 [Mercurialis annua]